MRVALFSLALDISLHPGDTLRVSETFIKGQMYAFSYSIRKDIIARKGNWVYIVTDYKGVVKAPILKATSNPRTTTHFDWLTPEQQVRVILTFLDTENEIEVFFDS